ncbi:FAD-binding oxidoreductase [Aminipila butyrica]|uniref:FAD-binding oxidoreductase n=1 Tax=Aminipila butyrica TaxID=433296 RepID=A0A858BX91_9FIRM|nr:FAD-binding oxidoreductase [Aminipila butyrica]QIB68696.1 FAD-binding oxidoreductase [Aminipila butyrica]
MNDFLCGLTGDIVTPFDPVYSEAKQGFNRAIQLFPLIIVYCSDERDVSNAVIWSRRNGVPIRIRSGGHNYEGYSNGNCTLVIDISRMNYMYIDECLNQLSVQGGVTNRQVYNFVSSKGYPFPGGTCPTVGVSGYSLGGGWGLSCRNFGLGCDSLEEIVLVNYEGAIIKANRENHCDLFWACRGAGGGNFGVIVSMTFNLPPKVENVTLIEIDYLNVDSQEQAEFLDTWQEWLKTADKRITLISRIYNSAEDGLAMLVRGIFYGEAEAAKQIMAEFLALDGADYNIESMTFLEAVTIIGSVYPPSEKFQSVSRFVFRDFTCVERAKLAGLIRERPQGSVFAGISMYALGGRVSEIGTDDTAFYYRHANYIIWLETIWEESIYAEENRKWTSNRFPYLKAITTGSYVNFPYGRLPDYLKEYYGIHANILKNIKKIYDPLNIFSFPQGIGKSACSNHAALYCPTLPLDKTEGPIDQSGDIRHRGFRYVSKR